MNTQSWNLSSGWLTNETCPNCGNVLEIIVDAVYYGDHDANGVPGAPWARQGDGEAAYCAACEGCGNAWSWMRTPEEALAAVFA